MKLKELKRIARRIKEPSFNIAKDGEVVIRGTFIGWYSGKDESILGTTIEVELKDTDEYARDMYSYAKDQDFDPLEHLFENAPVILDGSIDWTLYNSYYSHDNLRLPTIEESPLNMKLAWHHQLGKPEGIDAYYYIVWNDEFIYPAATKDWSGVTAFMLLKKK